MMSRKLPVLPLQLQRAALCLLLLCAATLAFDQPVQPTESLAFQRATHVRRGINLSMWYAQAPEYSAERLASFTTPGDFRLIKSLGFDHVRLSINPEPLIAENSGSPDKRVVTLRPDAMARLDQTVSQITATGLVLILDIHPEKEYQQTLARGDQGVASFLAFWKTFAAHFAGSDPRQVYFEVLNEPAMADNTRWAGIQARAVAIIRAATPRHTVIATGGEWGGIPGLLAIQPVHDDNVLYSFHDYDPMWFTHQGASWAGQEFSVLRNVPYPSSPATVGPILNLETTASGKQGLTEYGQQRWNRQRIDAEIAGVAAWGAQHRVPVYCGEFGVFRDFADPAMRARWLHDMRDSLEAHHIGWDMWDYQGGFALIVRINGQPKVDGPIATALGLKLVAP
ncbi:MAG TPA: cellulase family glycosylhydrolase [Granulicella sp.]|jgi:endoglucanase|nr:cellulase family glycosylhydrolase [Granulicella sp.]